jgi:glycosyltransferase involved in cell wall biosynthesis
LESVRWSDQIIVVDSGSSDDTVAIAKEFTPHVVQTDWPGYGPQKNRALGRATQEWVLSIDADERVTPELRSEVERAMGEAGGFAAYEMPRRSSYCGRIMRHGGWSPDYVTRLFKRDLGKFSDDLVHERVMVDGPRGRLNTPLIHYSYRDLAQVLDKVNSYSSASASMLYREGRRAGLGAAIVHGLWSFFRTYVLRRGFLDGKEGFMLAVSNAETSYYRYVKLMMLEKDSNKAAN